MVGTIYTVRNARYEHEPCPIGYVDLLLCSDSDSTEWSGRVPSAFICDISTKIREVLPARHWKDQPAGSREAEEAEEGKRRRLEEGAGGHGPIHVVTLSAEQHSSNTMDRCKSFIYNSWYPEAADVDAVDLKDLSRAADELGITELHHACVRLLSERPAADLTAAAADAIHEHYSATPAPYGLQDMYATICTICVDALITHLGLGDAVAFMDDDARKAQWLELCPATVLALLRDDRFATDSEDSVLAAVAAWVDANSPADEMARALLTRVRMLQLSAHFLLGILTNLSCIKQLKLVSWRKVAVLATYAKTPKHLRLSGTLPASWVCEDVRPASAHSGAGSISVNISSTKLQAKLKMLESRAQQLPSRHSDVAEIPLWEAGPRFVRGLGVQLGLKLRLQRSGVHELHAVLQAHLPAAWAASQGGEPLWHLGATFCVRTGDEDIVLAQDIAGGMLAAGHWSRPFCKLLYTFPVGQSIASLDTWRSVPRLLGEDDTLRLSVQLEGSATAAPLLQAPPQHAGAGAG